MLPSLSRAKIHKLGRSINCKMINDFRQKAREAKSTANFSYNQNVIDELTRKELHRSKGRHLKFKRAVFE